MFNNQINQYYNYVNNNKFKVLILEMKNHKKVF